MAFLSSFLESAANEVFGDDSGDLFDRAERLFGGGAGEGGETDGGGWGGALRSVFGDGGGGDGGETDGGGWGGALRGLFGGDGDGDAGYGGDGESGGDGWRFLGGVVDRLAGGGSDDLLGGLVDRARPYLDRVRSYLPEEVRGAADSLLGGEAGSWNGSLVDPSSAGVPAGWPSFGSAGAGHSFGEGGFDGLTRYSLGNLGGPDDRIVIDDGWTTGPDQPLGSGPDTGGMLDPRLTTHPGDLGRPSVPGLPGHGGDLGDYDSLGRPNLPGLPGRGSDGGDYDGGDYDDLGRPNLPGLPGRGDADYDDLVTSGLPGSEPGPDRGLPGHERWDDPSRPGPSHDVPDDPTFPVDRSPHPYEAPEVADPTPNVVADQPAPQVEPVQPAPADDFRSAIDDAEQIDTSMDAMLEGLE